MPLYRIFIERYNPDFSLVYPEKVVLPLEDFAEFYFKESGGDIKAKTNRAFNDAFSKMIQVLFSPSKKPHSSLLEMIKSNRNDMEDYAIKAYFSRHLAQKYMKTGKTASNIIDEDEKSWHRIFLSKDLSDMFIRVDKKLNSICK